MPSQCIYETDYSQQYISEQRLEFIIQGKVNLQNFFFYFTSDNKDGNDEFHACMIMITIMHVGHQ